LVEESLREYGIEEPEPEWAMIRLAFASPARLAMIQLQDVLGLGNEGRMNQPGTAGGWGWKLDELPSLDLAARLRAATEAAGRIA
jgi:4-alpha-glucanotransferase